MCVRVAVLQHCSILRHVAYVAQGACREMEGCRQTEDGWMAAFLSAPGEQSQRASRHIRPFAYFFFPPPFLIFLSLFPYHLLEQIHSSITLVDYITRFNLLGIIL